MTNGGGLDFTVHGDVDDEVILSENPRWEVPSSPGTVTQLDVEIETSGESESLLEPEDDFHVQYSGLSQRLYRPNHRFLRRVRQECRGMGLVAVDLENREVVAAESDWTDLVTALLSQDYDAGNVKILRCW